MAWLPWFQENWFTALQSLAILASFSFTAISLRRDERSRRVENLFRLNTGHRELWTHTFQRPELRRVLTPDPDLTRTPVTPDETQFVGFLILHLNTAHHAIKSGLMNPPDGLGADIRTFFANPIPRYVWHQSRSLQDADFAAFVEGHFSDLR
jgi:hypothetical protein